MQHPPGCPPGRRPVPAADADPVGLAEIAERVGVKRETAVMWNYRNLLPLPRWPSVSGAPAWDWHLDIVPFLTRTGRLPPQAAPETPAKPGRQTT